MTNAPDPTTTNGATPDPIARFLEGLQGGTGMPADVFAAGMVLDATVPNWRFGTVGRDSVAAELSRWYNAPARLESVRRREIDGGETVEIDFSWMEDGVPHAAHQMHVLTVTGGEITSDTVWCGGRWSAGLLAEMEAARGG